MKAVNHIYLTLFKFCFILVIFSLCFLLLEFYLEKTFFSSWIIATFIFIPSLLAFCTFYLFCLTQIIELKDEVIIIKRSKFFGIKEIVIFPGDIRSIKINKSDSYFIFIEKKDDTILKLCTLGLDNLDGDWALPQFNKYMVSSKIGLKTIK